MLLNIGQQYWFAFHMTVTTLLCCELAQKIELVANHKFKILFTTMESAPTSKPDLVRLGLPCYIPNSLFFDFENEFVDKNTSFSHMMPSVNVFQCAARRLGLNLEDEIVVYDDFGNFCASRAWFMLLAMGFTNVKVLDGGLPEWLNGNHPTQKTLISPIATSSVELKPSANFGFVGADYITNNLSMLVSPQITTDFIHIIDARSNGRYTGTDAEPRDNMRSGHIPTSSNIHYAAVQDNGAFKSYNKMGSLFENQKIDLGNEIVISCGSGITACIIAQAAFSLGANCIKVYDASWSEWGASQTLPIEVGQ
jgi:thiosulfate/3-mercaptopyruvate sulfurtransferase